MNPFEFVIAIVAITTIGSIIRMRVKHRYGITDDDPRDGRRPPVESGENVRLREEVRMLKERIQTLERITVDKENSLSREIDELRDR
jgi:hypothetical protein